ncbi:unnamed protein product [Moneuplotes crassus]|uniref:Enhancer of rudimentary homolog n=1 Tax=Euplotes crassus TaxID=5936 RepID=A0AAD1Y8K3_EUPCR|nr:unnamed protein product [Moneuplotes crassus]
MSHTIMMIQFIEDENSRTYLDFETLPKAFQALMELYEQKLKQMNPNLNSISYDCHELQNYIDSLRDISFLVLNSKGSQYAPHGKKWIKSNLYEFVKTLSSLNDN